MPFEKFKKRTKSLKDENNKSWKVIVERTYFKRRYAAVPNYASILQRADILISNYLLLHISKHNTVK